MTQKILDVVKPGVVTGDDLSPVTVKTSLPRELLFVQCHTIHHLAILKILLRDQPVTLDKTFGMAPATLQFHHSSPDTLTTEAE